jgi:hypothetical protein
MVGAAFQAAWSVMAVLLVATAHSAPTVSQHSAHAVQAPLSTINNFCVVFVDSNESTELSVGHCEDAIILQHNLDSQAILATHSTDLCLGTIHDSDANGSPLSLVPCDAASKSQKWTRAGPTYVNGHGYCMTYDGTDDVDRLVQSECAKRSPSQHFHHRELSQEMPM